MQFIVKHGRYRVDSSTVADREVCQTMSAFKKRSFAQAVALFVFAGSVANAQDGAGTAPAPASADQVAKELSNPAGSLASLVNNLEYRSFKGDLPGADSQDTWLYSFQPVLPFPVGNEGRRIIFRPLIPVPLNQPYFDSSELGFDDDDINLGDVTFDLAYAGTEMQSDESGYLWGIGANGTIPTATSDNLGGDQWRIGPEVFGGVVRPWGTAGILVGHQWDMAGDNYDHSVTAGQYFYAYGLGNGWQLASGPNFSYDWNADSGNRWTVPLGLGLAKTTKIGSTTVKFQAQAFYYVEQPDSFGPDWGLKFSITPVIKNPFLR